MVIVPQMVKLLLSALYFLFHVIMYSLATFLGVCVCAFVDTLHWNKLLNKVTLDASWLIADMHDEACVKAVFYVTTRLWIVFVIRSWKAEMLKTYIMNQAVVVSHLLTLSHNNKCKRYQSMMCSQCLVLPALLPMLYVIAAQVTWHVCTH